MKKLIYFAMFLWLPIAVMADTENLITISANGVRTTYAFSTFKSATIEDPYADILTLNVKFNDGTKSVGNIRTLIREVTKDEPQKEVEIEPSKTSATFTWPQVPGAVTYQLIIYKDDTQTERLCTLTFNSNGQLINIDFNPQGPTQKTAQTIFRFTVTGLEAGHKYDYSMQALGSADEVIDEQNGTFETLTTSTNDVNDNNVNIYTRGKTIVVDCDKESEILFYNTIGQQVGDCIRTQHCECTVTIAGTYTVVVNGESHRIGVVTSSF